MINNLPEMSFAQHFGELKSRIVKILAVFTVSFIVAYIFKEQLFNILAQPLLNIFEDNQHFIFTHLAEAFFVYLKLAFWAALFITIPFALIQVYLFIAPGLYKTEKRFVIPTFTFSVILFYAGISFVYIYLMPKAWEFFLSFSNSNIDIALQAKISEYFNFSLQLMLAFGLAFQLPIILLVLAKAGLITVKTLINGRKYAIILMAVVSALLTPPDLISQIALIIPLTVMYEITILLLKLNKNSKLEK
ncbi:MAG: Sec-independent protein translocase protein TatC [Proteobacteria bacterium]|nr:MAG: Sec-independent protein translocase protein TatC [Pseudomonadota bacterium]